METKPDLKYTSQEEEMENARSEGRQPYCIYCEELLNKVEQTQDARITWTWNGTRYDKRDDGEAEPARCGNCGVSDWAFVDSHLIDY